MLALATVCVLAGIVPGYVIDAIAPVTQFVIGGHLPTQSTTPWLSIVPIAQGRSSYNGLLVFLFIAASLPSLAGDEPANLLRRHGEQPGLEQQDENAGQAKNCARGARADNLWMDGDTE